MTKIIEKFRGMKKKFFSDILESYPDPIDLAYFYARGATDSEKKLVKEAVRGANPQYIEIFGKYSQNSILFDTEVGLRGRFSEASELEEKTV